MVRPHARRHSPAELLPLARASSTSWSVRTRSCCSTRSSSPRAAGRTASRCWSAGAHTGSPRRSSVPGIGGPIRDLLIDDSRDWRTKSVKTLQQNYPRVDAHAAWRSCSATASQRLAGVQRACDPAPGRGARDRRPPIVRASDLGVEGSATELLSRSCARWAAAPIWRAAAPAATRRTSGSPKPGIEVIPQELRRPPHGLSVLHALLSGERSGSPR